MTDKQLQDARDRWEAEKSAARSSHIDRVPDWAWGQAFKEISKLPLSQVGDLWNAVSNRARELSAQQPERYKFVADVENGGGEIVDTSDNTSLAICWNGSEMDALKIVSALNAQQAAAARGIPNTPGLIQRWNAAGDATEWVKPEQPARHTPSSTAAQIDFLQRAAKVITGQPQPARDGVLIGYVSQSNINSAIENDDVPVLSRRNEQNCIPVFAYALSPPPDGEADAYLHYYRKPGKCYAVACIGDQPAAPDDGFEHAWTKPLYLRPSRGVEVDADMLARALNAQPFGVSDNDATRVWELFKDGVRTDLVMNAALQAALSGVQR